MGGVIWSKPAVAKKDELVSNQDSPELFIKYNSMGNSLELYSHTGAKKANYHLNNHGQNNNQHSNDIASPIQYEWKISPNLTEQPSSIPMKKMLKDSHSFSSSPLTKPTGLATDRLFSDIDLSIVLKLTLDAGGADFFALFGPTVLAKCKHSHIRNEQMTLVKLLLVFSNLLKRRRDDPALDKPINQCFALFHGIVVNFSAAAADHSQLSQALTEKLIGNDTISEMFLRRIVHASSVIPPVIWITLLTDLICAIRNPENPDYSIIRAVFSDPKNKSLAFELLEQLLKQSERQAGAQRLFLFLWYNRQSCGVVQSYLEDVKPYVEVVRLAKRQSPSRISLLLLFGMVGWGKSSKCAFETINHIIQDQSCVETLMLGLLSILYEYSQNQINYIDTYIVLSTLLCLSEDNSFISLTNKMIFTNITWIKEQTFAQLSLNSLLVYLITRLLQVNLFGTKDLYVHEMGLAILQNFATNIENLNSYVAEQLILFTEAVFKRLLSLLRGPSVNNPYVDESSLLSAVLYTEGAERVLRNCLQSLIAIMTITLVQRSRSNEKLVYSIIYRYQMFLEIQHGLFEDRFIYRLNTMMETIYDQVEKQIDLTDAESDAVQIIIKSSLQNMPIDPKDATAMVNRFKLSLHEGTFRFFEPIINELIDIHSPENKLPINNMFQQ